MHFGSLHITCIVWCWTSNLTCPCRLVDPLLYSSSLKKMHSHHCTTKTNQKNACTPRVPAWQTSWPRLSSRSGCLTPLSGCGRRRGSLSATTCSCRLMYSGIHYLVMVCICLVIVVIACLRHRFWLSGVLATYLVRGFWKTRQSHTRTHAHTHTHVPKYAIIYIRRCIRHAHPLLPSRQGHARRVWAGYSMDDAREQKQHSARAAWGESATCGVWLRRERRCLWQRYVSHTTRTNSEGIITAHLAAQRHRPSPPPTSASFSSVKSTITKGIASSASSSILSVWSVCSRVVSGTWCRTNAPISGNRCLDHMRTTLCIRMHIMEWFYFTEWNVYI